MRIVFAVISICGLTSAFVEGVFQNALEQFSRHIFQELLQTNDQQSLILSPFAIQACLAMLQMGAEGQTAEQIERGLNFNKMNIQNMTMEFQSLLDKYQKGGVMQIANKIYVMENEELNDQYNELLSRRFYTTADTVDFTNPENASKVINHWIALKTNNRIENVVSVDSMNVNTRLYLLSVIYFNGKWATAFPVAFTRERNFYVDSKHIRKIPMMNIQSKFKYGFIDELDATAVLLPYKDSDLSMLIILPNTINGLTKMTSKLRDIQLSSIISKNLRYAMDINLFLPKFKADFKVELSDILKNMGMEKMFYSGDFGKMLKSPEPLAISEVIHQASIDVNEEGSEAAAVAVNLLTLILISGLLFYSASTITDAQEINYRLGSFNRQLLHDVFTTNENQNILVSPFAVQSALSMVLMGTDGEAAAEIEQVLRQHEPEFQMMQRYKTLLTKYKVEKNLILTNLICLNNKFRLKESFIQMLSEGFYSTPLPVDFSQPNIAVNTINVAIAEDTDFKITNMLQRGNLGNYPEAILLSATQFDGNFALPIPAEGIEERPFRRNATNRINIPMLRYKGKYQYALLTKHLLSTAIRIPYKDSDFSLIVIKPGGNMRTKRFMRILQEIDFDLRSLRRKFAETEGYVFLPKFKAEFQVGLKHFLTKMGMTKFFTTARFDKMIEQNQAIHFDDVIHKASVEIKESVVNAIPYEFAKGLHPQYEIFEADRTFYYAIVNSNFEPLFEGTFTGIEIKLINKQIVKLDYKLRFIIESVLRNCLWFKHVNRILALIVIDRMGLHANISRFLCIHVLLLLIVYSVKGTGDVDFKTSLGSFSQQLFRELFKSNGQKNIIYSPFSIHSCLAMTRMGADGQTASEMDQGLRVNGQLPEHVAENYHKLLAKYEDGKMLKIANKIYVKEHTVLQDDFKNVLWEKFFSMPETINFVHTKEAAETINKWVESKTDNKIHNLISPSVLGEDTHLVLVSAIHFKGEWKTKFDPEYTSDHDFYIDEKTSVKVPMMVTEDDRFEYADLNDLDCSAVRLPYENSDLSMLVLLPNSRTGLRALEEKLRNVSLKSLQSKLSKQHVEVFLPKFQAEFEINLQEPLMNMGIKQMFGRADFSKMKKSSKPLYISSAVHKAFISVTEFGTEASGATGIVATSRSLPIFFSADHPFYYAIINEDFIPIFQGTVVHF
ncbi:uncharacterized protein [Musca autumnalis]|uniref:uncharacterized protein n=1 Tax=Musca autumnalis TaxID=221902 RepID=UPI003CF9E7F9